MNDRGEKIRKISILILCLFVCLFFVNAKLSRLHSRLELTSGADAKNFTIYQKMDNKGGSTVAVLFVLLIAASFCLPRREQLERFTPALHFSPVQTGYELYRFLRPPPMPAPIRL